MKNYFKKKKGRNAECTFVGTLERVPKKYLGRRQEQGFTKYTEEGGGERITVFRIKETVKVFTKKEKNRYSHFLERENTERGRGDSSARNTPVDTTLSCQSGISKTPLLARLVGKNFGMVILE